MAWVAPYCVPIFKRQRGHVFTWRVGRREGPLLWIRLHEEYSEMGGGPACDREGHEAEPEGSVQYPSPLWDFIHSAFPFTASPFASPPLLRWHLLKSMQIRRRPGGPIEIRDGGGV